MKTINRIPKEIDTSISNYNKFNNQLNFKGIVLDTNIFAVDQESFADTNNVYVDEDMSLVTREPLTVEELPTGILNDGEQLKDIQYIKDVTVYIVQNDKKFKIVAYKNGISKILSDINKYYLCTYDQYILCFKDTGAQVLNVNDFNTGWQDFSSSKLVEVPTTKITTGPSVQEFDKNEFTDAYKNVYIRTNDAQTVLPAKGNSSVKGLVRTSYGTFNFTDFEHPEESAQYRILKPLNLELNETIYNISAGGSTVAITLRNRVLISYNNGAVFTSISFPTPEAGAFCGANTLSEDGKCYFYIDKQGVYRLTLDDLVWTLIRIKDGKTNETIGLAATPYAYCFKNAEVFTFYIADRVYFKAPGMWTNDKQYDNTLCYCKTSALWSPSVYLIKYRMNVTIGKDGNGALCCIAPSYNNGDSHVVTIIGLGTEAVKYVENTFPKTITLYGTITIEEITKISSFSNGHAGYGVIINGAYADGVMVNGAYVGSDIKLYNCEVGYDSINNTKYIKETDIKTLITAENGASDVGIPIMLNDSIGLSYSPQGYTPAPNYNRYIIDTSKSGEGGNNYYSFPTIENNEHVQFDKIFAVADDKFYFYDPIDNKIFTNAMSDKDVVEVTYSYSGTSGYYTKIPTVSYSGSELYLGFDNLLQITKNSKSDTGMLFNLPAINNQNFTNNITGIINISTTQLAIFFDNEITICSKVENEISGYAYEYRKTRLQLGTRLGDDIINTLDGAATVFANARGLALMNYQAYMATSDQVLTFISDKIIELWKTFYSNSIHIKIIQMKNYIYISNGTNEYLMLDMRTQSWWKFTVPVNVNKLTTNQTNLYLLSDKLYLFNLEYDKTKYYDEVYDKHGNAASISWRIESQRLHFGLPNHYKNIKQLVFQLKQANDYQNTIKAQVKIYRKTIDYSEPQIVYFDVDEYRTFVKRFNYWKINELQWILTNDPDTTIPAQLKLNGINIKYEIGEEVR